MEKETRLKQRALAELHDTLPHILDAPKAEGILKLIVVRPEHGKRITPDEANLSLAAGVEGDHWITGCHLSTDQGAPHPDVQICMMSARCIEAIAGDIGNWAPAGDNLFIDMDLSPANMPPGTRFSIGSVELVVTEEPHNGCNAFIERYGRDACIFVNTGEGKKHRLRGIYARVTRDGRISRGDRVIKL